MDLQKSLKECKGFDWDKGNKNKNFKKHNVSNEECELMFLDEIVLLMDETHSINEKRMVGYGQARGRLLTIVFTIRKRKIRVISARDQSKKEKEFYKKYLS